MPPRRFRRLGLESLEGRLPLAATRFAVIGDFGDDSTYQADVTTLVKSWDPDFIVTVGDNNYDLGEAETIDANIGKYYQEFIGDYLGTYGPGSPTNRFFPTLGNHDWGLINPGDIQPISITLRCPVRGSRTLRATNGTTSFVGAMCIFSASIATRTSRMA